MMVETLSDEGKDEKLTWSVVKLGWRGAYPRSLRLDTRRRTLATLAPNGTATNEWSLERCEVLDVTDDPQGADDAVLLQVARSLPCCMLVSNLKFSVASAQRDHLIASIRALLVSSLASDRLEVSEKAASVAPAIAPTVADAPRSPRLDVPLVDAERVREVTATAGSRLGMGGWQVFECSLPTSQPWLRAGP